MGIGMVAVVAPDALAEISRAACARRGQRALPIGTVRAGGAGVVYDLGGTGEEPTAL